MILLQVEQMKLQNFGSIPVCMHIILENILLDNFILDYTLQLLPNRGTTSCLATLVFPKDFKTSQFEFLSKSVGKITPGSAVLEGIHAEVSLIVHSYRIIN